MKRLLLALAFLCAFAASAWSQSVTVAGTQVRDNTGGILTAGKWCFGSTCFTVTGGAFSGTVTAGTQTVTVTDTGGSTIYLTVANVSIAGTFYTWDTYVVPSTGYIYGIGPPRIACTPGALYGQTDGAQNKWQCIAINGLGTWQGVAVPGTPWVFQVGTVTTLAAGAPAYAVNVGTPNQPVIDFGIPAGIPGCVVGYTCSGVALLAGANFTGAVTGPQIGGAYYVVPGADLATVIGTVPSGNTLILPCGTYALAGSSTPLPAITLQGAGPEGSRCAVISLTGSAQIGMALVSGTTIDNVAITGAVAQAVSIIGQSNIHITNSKFYSTASLSVTGNAGCSAAVYFQGGSDIWIEHNEFTGNGPATTTGYFFDVCADWNISTANYTTARPHINSNWFHGSTTSFNVSCFNCESVDAQSNTIDSNNQWDGSTQAYALELYNSNEGVCATLTRVSNVATCTFSSSPPVPVITYPVGAPIYVGHAASSGDTDFNGAFTVVTSSPTQITWAQAAPDGTTTANTATVNFGFGHDLVAHNHISNVAGNAIYAQSVVHADIDDNVILNPALQMPDTSLCQAGISIQGQFINITSNNVDGSGKAGVCAGESKDLTFSGNNIHGPATFGIYVRGIAGASFSGDTISGAGTAGIGNTTMGSFYNCLDCTFTNETVKMASGAGGIVFDGTEKSITFTGGQVLSGASGLSSAAVLIDGASTTQVEIHKMTIECAPYLSSVATSEFGLKYGGTHSTIEGLNVVNCDHDGSAAGIEDEATGLDNVYSGNTVTGVGTGANGIIAIGTNVLIFNNIVWNNTTPLDIAGTNNLAFANQIAEGQPPTPFSSAQLATIPFTGTFNLGTVATGYIGGVFPILRSGTQFTQFSVGTVSFTGCTAPAQVSLVDCGTGGSCASPTTLASLNVQITAGQINGTSAAPFPITPTVGHTLGYAITNAGTGCTGLSFTATVQ